MRSILNNISKSLSVEITKFFQHLRLPTLGSKQAFSQARYKIQPEAFVDLNDTFVRAYYERGGRLYGGKYLLLATDGSTYELPWTDELRAEFGEANNGQGSPKCMMQGVKIWDVLNRVTVHATLGGYEAGEIQLFKTAWARARSLLHPHVSAPLLVLGDMYYPSFGLIAQLQEEATDFLFRCKPTFCREIEQFLHRPESDAVLSLPIASDPCRKYWFKKSTGRPEVPKTLTVRAIRVQRPNGEETCLLTSLPAHTLDAASISALYPLRWGEEVSFHFDNNRAEMENFSAKLPAGIRQEWYANILATNITQLLIEDAQQRLDTVQQAGKNQYTYQINRSVALGLVKDELPKMLFGKQAPSTFYRRLIQLILRHREPVRPHRSYPRKRKHKLKFSLNLRRVI